MKSTLIINNSKHLRAFNLIIFILIVTNLMLPVQAEDFNSHRPHSIEVDGLGYVSSAPDKANLTLSVEVQAKTAEASRELAAIAMTALINAIKQEHVTDNDIQTRHVSLFPVYNQDPANKINNYQLTNQITVCIRDISRVSTIIDSAVRAGGNAVHVQDLNFGLANPELALSQAREKAFINAKTKAEQYAKLAGVTLARPWTIRESVASPQMPTPYATMSLRSSAVSASANTPIQVGVQEVSVSVNVIFDVE